LTKPLNAEKLGNTGLRKLMYERRVQVEFSEAEVLILHATAVVGFFGDGRSRLTKIMRRRISPVAMKILEERKEYV